MQIEVTTAGAVSEGEYVVQADTDDYKVGQTVPAGDYDAEEQDWQHVVRKGGHADIGWLELAMYNGETYRVSGDWGQTVWRYVGDDGEPVRQDPSGRD